MARNKSTSIFAESFNALIEMSLNRSESLGKVLEAPEVDVTTAFATGDKAELSMQFKQVSKVIKARGVLENERDVFFVQLGGFDTHAGLHATLDAKYAQVNAALVSFEKEMKAQGIWDDVAVLQVRLFMSVASDEGAARRTRGAVCVCVCVCVCERERGKRLRTGLLRKSKRDITRTET